MKIENTEVYGFKGALRAMRNPKDSWEKSDSLFNIPIFNTIDITLGDADKLLSQKLTKAGPEHSKHLRMIQVWADLTLPRYIWVEFDTYKHIEKVSCSTMHKITSRRLTEEDFEIPLSYSSLYELNSLIETYTTAESPELKQICKRILKGKLPEGFLQKRTINTNYQQLLNIYKQRKNHELLEWHHICDWILELPYFVELTGIE